MLVQKLFAFYETRRFSAVINELAVVPYPSPVLSSPPQPHTLILKSTFNNVVSAMSKSSKWSLGFRFFRLKFCVHFSYFLCSSHVTPLHFITQKISRLDDEYKLWRPSLCSFPSYVQIFVLTLCSQSPSFCVLPLWRETRFHTHTKSNGQNDGLGSYQDHWIT